MEQLLKNLRELVICVTSNKGRGKKKQRDIKVDDDILFQILTWLPAKSLMRFKCVCKAWNTLIRYDLSFVKSHYARSQARPAAHHLLFELFVNSALITPRRHAQLERFYLQLEPAHTSTKLIICSNHCNGLLCFYEHHHAQVHLYNVTTREIKVLPFSPSKKTWYYPKLFLGFDLVMEKYKLLHVFDKNGRPKIEILTLGTNSWREIELIPEKSSRDYFPRECIFLNGVLYWTNRENNTMDYFDFREEKFGILSATADGNIMQTTLWEKLVSYWSSFRYEYKKFSLVSEEAKEVLLEFNSDDPNSKKVAALVEAEFSDMLVFPLATASFSSAPSTLLFSRPVCLRRASSFVENIIPLTFIDV